jgi:hypothetical protein
MWKRLCQDVTGHAFDRRLPPAQGSSLRSRTARRHYTWPHRRDSRSHAPSCRPRRPPCTVPPHRRTSLCSEHTASLKQRMCFLDTATLGNLERRLAHSQRQLQRRHVREAQCRSRQYLGSAICVNRVCSKHADQHIVGCCSDQLDQLCHRGHSVAVSTKLLLLEQQQHILQLRTHQHMHFVRQHRQIALFLAESHAASASTRAAVDRVLRIDTT